MNNGRLPDDSKFTPKEISVIRAAFRAAPEGQNFLNNLTPHEVVLDGEAVPPSGLVARVEVEEVDSMYEMGWPVKVQRTGSVTGVPPYCLDGALSIEMMKSGCPGYIVSAQVRLALPRRIDLYDWFTKMTSVVYDGTR